MTETTNERTNERTNKQTNKILFFSSFPANSLGKLLSEAVRKVKQAKHATDKEETHDALRDGNEHYFVDIQQRKEAQLLRKLYV